MSVSKQSRERRQKRVMRLRCKRLRSIAAIRSSSLFVKWANRRRIKAEVARTSG